MVSTSLSRRIRMSAWTAALLGTALFCGVVAGPSPAASSGPSFAPPVYVDQQLAGGEPEVIADAQHGTLIYSAHEGTTHLYRDGVVSSPRGGGGGLRSSSPVTAAAPAAQPGSMTTASSPTEARTRASASSITTRGTEPSSSLRCSTTPTGALAWASARFLPAVPRSRL